jgi:lysyl-tRNA synthetase class 2
VERVFEIGKVFRNEGVDQSHNPEFTSCEFYQAYGNFEELVDMTEELLVSMTHSVTGDGGSLNGLSLARPFPRLHFLDTLSAATNTDLDRLLSSGSADAAVPTLLELCRRHGLSAEPPHTAATLLDRLGGHFVESQCHRPTFITHHPLVMSPLAKADAARVRTLRFIDSRWLPAFFPLTFPLLPLPPSPSLISASASSSLSTGRRCATHTRS